MYYILNFTDRGFLLTAIKEINVQNFWQSLWIIILYLKKQLEITVNIVRMWYFYYKLSFSDKESSKFCSHEVMTLRCDKIVSYQNVFLQETSTAFVSVLFERLYQFCKPLKATREVTTRETT